MGAVALRRLYGDESELHFWTVAAHYLHSLAPRRSASAATAEGAAPRDRAGSPLDICYDTLCENAYFQVLQRVWSDLEDCRLSYACVCESALLGRLGD